MARYPHLMNRNGHYYFRIAVPLALMESLGRKELTYSLKTKDYTEARIRSAALLNIAQEVFSRGLMQDEPQRILTSLTA